MPCLTVCEFGQEPWGVVGAPMDVIYGRTIAQDGHSNAMVDNVIEHLERHSLQDRQ